MTRSPDDPAAPTTIPAVPRRDAALDVPPAGTVVQDPPAAAGTAGESTPAEHTLPAMAAVRPAGPAEDDAPPLPPPGNRAGAVRDGNRAGADREGSPAGPPPRQSPPYPRRVFERYVAPARARPQIWRILLGVALIAGFYAGVMAGLVALAVRILPRDGLPGLMEDVGLGRTPWGMLALLASFAALAAGPMIAARLLHRRPAATLFGPGPRVLRHFLLGMAVVAAIYGGANLLTLALPGEPTEPGLPPGRWLAFLPLALIGVAIQTGAEELVFRGYLLQSLAARFRSPLIWMALPSLAFGCLHFEPGLMGPNALYVVAATALFGLAAADLTARTGSLGLAWGLHFANNCAALLFVTSGEALTGLALRRSPVEMATPEGLSLLALDMLLVAAVWGACRWILRR